MIRRQSANVTDIAVVGGGPAGSLAAFILAREGAHVTLIDRGGVRPGSVELLSGRARRLLEQNVHRTLAETVGGIEVFETLSLWDTSLPVGTSAMFDPWGPGMAVDRRGLDRTLREIASEHGVTVLANTEVRAAQRLHNRWQLSLRQNRDMTTLYANYLVLAAGHRAARLLGFPSTGAASQVALMSCISSGQSTPGNSLYVEAVADGWWYALPEPGGGWFIGFCTKHDLVKQRSESLSELWIRKLRQTRLLFSLFTEPFIAGPIYGRPVGVDRLDKAYGEGWLALGDSAFTPDPLSGKGIEFAIESAIRGTRSLLAYAQRPAQQQYNSWVCEYARQHEQARRPYFSQANPS